MADRKIAGQCTLCDELLFETKTTWPEGHPYAGEPRDKGAPHPNAMRLGFVLTDGSTVDLTFCEDCSHDAGEKLPEIWSRCMAAMAYEVDHIVEIGTKPRTATEMFALRTMNARLARQVPLGVLYSRRWTEIR